MSVSDLIDLLKVKTNRLTNWTDLAHLRKLKKLNGVALQGNPLESECPKCYRVKINLVLPQLREIDFTVIHQ